MRASPALQVSLNRFGVWRAALATLVLLAIAAIVAWAVSSNPAQAHQRWAWPLAVLLAITALGCGASLARLAPCSLRWDGQRWHLSRSAGEPEQPGDLTVALDLGAWMLLRFTADADGARTRWLPVQRRGLEAGWHALRCAVYAPRSDPAAEFR